MFYNYGIILMIAIFSLLSAVEIDFIKTKKYFFWKWSFYFCINLWILSFAKYYLGYRKENLIESFWNAKFITLLHYSVPLIIIAVALPILLKLLLRENDIKLICYFDSSFFLAFSFTFFFVRKLNNKTFCIAFVLAVMIVMSAVFLKKIKSDCLIDLSKDSIKQKARQILPILLYYLITVVIFTPNELYLNNAKDFPLPYWYFFGKLLLSGVIVVLMLMAGMILYLNKEHLNIYLIFMFAFLTAGYIQGLFFNGSMGVLDGTGNNVYSNTSIIINFIVWFVLIGIFVFLAWKKYAFFEKLMRTVSIWIILIQIVTLGTLFITAEEISSKDEMILMTDGMLDVGEKDNIVIFVLDKFDGIYVDEILEEDKNFFQPLNDFVFYKNAASTFNPTYDSIPFLLTGSAFDEDSHIDYVQYAYDNTNLLTDIRDAGYDIGVYTDKRYVAEQMKDIISNYEEGIQRTCSMIDLFSLMKQCSMYKMAPLAVKYYYIYDTSDIALLTVNDKIVNIEDDLPFYHRLVREGLSVSKEDKKSTFRFIHMHGGHPPYTMTEDFQHIEYDARRDEHWGSGVSQRKGAMKIVYEYIAQLKKLGKYEDALIVITSDHGITEKLYNSDGNMIDTSYPILFVKEPYDSHENMVTSSAPVCHQDLIATIRKNIGVIATDKGLAEIGANEKRVRYMYVSTPDVLEKYEIDGEIDKINHWSLLYKKQKELETTH